MVPFMNIRMCIFSVLLALPAMAAAQTPPPVGAPITTMAQAEYYAGRMQTICVDNKVGAPICDCVGESALKEAVTGSYAMRWQLLWLNTQGAEAKYLDSIPLNQRDRARFFMNSMPQGYSDILEAEYQHECSK